MPIGSNYLERGTVQVHRMDELPCSDEAQAQALALLQLDLRCGWIRFAVDGEVVGLHARHRHGSVGVAVEVAPLGEHDHLVHVGLRPCGGFWVYDKRTIEPHGELDVRVEVRMVPVGAALVHLKFVCEVLTGLDRGLGHVGHPVHAVGYHDAVPVDGRGHGQAVVQDNAYLVALGHADERPRHHAVVAPGRHGDVG